MRLGQPRSTDDLDRAGGGAGGRVRRGGTVVAGRWTCAAGDDADFGESVLDVARYRNQQQGEPGEGAVEGGTATGAHSGELSDAAVGRGVRASPSVAKNSPQE